MSIATKVISGGVTSERQKIKNFASMLRNVFK